MAGLSASIFRIFFLVRDGAISDKYGTGWFAALISCLIFNGTFDWSLWFSPTTAALILFSFFGFIALGIFFSVRLTDYSRVRRQSVQEVALLRFRFQELEKNLRKQTAHPVF